MEKDERFDPVVIICPYILYGETTMFKEMDQAYNSFFNRGYHVISTYDKNSKKWLDIKEMVDPDIVFFTNPHPLTKDEYYIGNFPKTLTCYVPYTFQTTYHYNQNYNRFFHNVLWKAYYQTDIHKKIAAKMKKKKINISVTVVKKLLKKHGFTKRKAIKSMAIGSSENRNEQFEKIAQLKEQYLLNGNPVVSMDSKKKNF